ncbi:hypothetical protein CEXT_706391 [Caerostris extrusa]|uniref:Uncharacterized protein n=1 Tax=Caerostris extrusa TaxID=172846 RepID=A0AAV4QE88_CAEEX|nr:hypothetical protein CEXT_706391 [Caerostris extrusa]
MNLLSWFDTDYHLGQRLSVSKMAMFTTSLSSLRRTGLRRHSHVSSESFPHHFTTPAAFECSIQITKDPFLLLPFIKYAVCRSLQWCPRDGETERSLTGRNLYGNTVVSDGQKDDRGGIFVREHLLRGCRKKELFPLVKWGSEGRFLFIIDIELYGWKWFLKMAILLAFPMF